MGLRIWDCELRKVSSVEQEEIIANFELRISNLRKHKADWRLNGEKDGRGDAEKRRDED